MVMKASARLLLAAAVVASVACAAAGQELQAVGACSPGEDIAIQVDKDSTDVTITLSFPAGLGWVAVGFGNSVMSGTYAIIVDEGAAAVVQERKLGSSGAGTSLSSTVTLDSLTTSGGLTTAVMSRSLSGATGDHFDFSASSLSAICSYRSSGNFASTKHSGYDDELSLTFGTPTPQPTGAPSASPVPYPTSSPNIPTLSSAMRQGAPALAAAVSVAFLVHHL